MPGAHRDGDARSCGALTTVINQASTYVDGKLWAVQGDPNTHGDGGLIPTKIGVFIEKKPIIVKGDNANADGLCASVGGEHCSPKSAVGSGITFTYGGDVDVPIIIPPTPMPGDIVVVVPQCDLVLSPSLSNVVLSSLNYPGYQADAFQANAFQLYSVPITPVNIVITVPQGDLVVSSSAPNVALSSLHYPGYQVGAFQADAFQTYTVPMGAITVPQGNVVLSSSALNLTLSSALVVSQGDLVLSPTLSNVVLSSLHYPGYQVGAFQADAFQMYSVNDIIVPQGNLASSSSAPNVVSSHHVSITVPQGNLVSSPPAPSVALSNLLGIVVPQGDLVLSSLAPSAVTSNYLGIMVPQGDLASSSSAVSVVLSSHPGFQADAFQADAFQR